MFRLPKYFLWICGKIVSKTENLMPKFGPQFKILIVVISKLVFKMAIIDFTSILPAISNLMTHVYEMKVSIVKLFNVAYVLDFSFSN